MWQKVINLSTSQVMVSDFWWKKSRKSIFLCQIMNNGHLGIRWVENVKRWVEKWGHSWLEAGHNVAQVNAVLLTKTYCEFWSILRMGSTCTTFNSCSMMDMNVLLGNFPKDEPIKRAFGLSVVTEKKTLTCFFLRHSWLSEWKSWKIQERWKNVRRFLDRNLARGMNREKGGWSTPDTEVLLCLSISWKSLTPPQPTTPPWMCVWVYKQHVSDWHLLFNSRLAQNKIRTCCSVANVFLWHETKLRHNQS